MTDAYTATVWIHAKGTVFGIDTDRLALMGDSAGANLATVTCMVLRDKGEQAKISLQILIYPVTDMVTDQSLSRQELAEGHLLTAGMMKWFTDHYLTDCDDQAAADPYVSPLVTENLSNLPPAIIVVAEYDPLRDEGIEYAARLKEAGNFVDLRQEKGMIHGFFWLGGAIDRGREILEELGQDLRQSLVEAEIY